MVHQVHHGGAGTTAAGLKAAVIPFNKFSYTQFCFDCPYLKYVHFFSISAQPQSYRSSVTNPFGETEFIAEA